MNSLLKLSGSVRRAAVALMIISCLAVVVSAQKVDPQSQGRFYGDAGFRGEPINLNVVNADIRDILNYITEQYGINFVLDKSVKSVPVTVNVSEVPWNIALDSILRAQELGVQVNGTILRVADSKTLATEGEIFREQQNNKLDLSPLYTEFIRLNYARASGTVASGSLTAGTSTGSGGAAPTAGGASNDAGILGIIKRRLSRRGAVEVDGRSNTIIITDVRENIDAIRQLVTLLDQPEPQVEIETRIVIANRNFSRDIGVQLFGIVTGPRGSGGQGGTLPTPTTGGVPAPPGLPLNNPTNNLFSSIPSTVIGLTTGVFGTAQISALISAGEEKGQAKIIATPRVTALNNRPAEVKSGAKIPVQSIQPGGSATGTTIVTIEYIDVPLRLAITPQITDVGTVILNVVAENSSISRRISGGAAPAIDTQSVTTQVTVPDGGTTVVGGVLSDVEQESQSRTPGLSRIPVLGNLFKRKGVSRDTQEILFFITPRIVRPDLGSGSPSVAPKSTTIIQPVPLGNPPSNSDQTPPPVVNPNTQLVVPVQQQQPVVQPQASPMTTVKP